MKVHRLMKLNLVVVLVAIHLGLTSCVGTGGAMTVKLPRSDTKRMDVFGGVASSWIRGSF